MPPQNPQGPSVRAAAWVCVLLFLLPGAPVAQAQDAANTCEVGERPDVIVGDLAGVFRWGRVGEITGFSVGTTSCNVGTCWLKWINDTHEHPAIAQNMFRLKDGRFEQIGQSWLKHGFFALSLEFCNTGCMPTSGDHLGVNCSDPYSAGLNGTQNGLGPKFEVNAALGLFPFPPTDGAATGDAIFKRLQLHDLDLEPARNPGARYYVEGQYVTRDDAAAGVHFNNASHREVAVLEASGEYDLMLLGETQREQPGIKAWAAADPGVLLQSVDVPLDGRFWVGSRADEISPGFWQYEYAVQNLNSHRSARGFRVPVPADADVETIGFHDVDYHSGEPFSGTDWPGALIRDGGPGQVVWSTDSFDEDPLANALRWGTLYNFRFFSNVPPGLAPQPVYLDLYRNGTPQFLEVNAWAPRSCNQDGVCDPGESCVGCPGDCAGGGPGESCCGDGECAADEGPCDCPGDCGPCPLPCGDDPECDDGVFCNGVEVCDAGFCAAGGDPCAGSLCDEPGAGCVECVYDDNCDDGSFCSGFETCVDQQCVAGGDPCPGAQCDDEAAACVACLSDAHCADDLFCNGDERCVDGACEAGDAVCTGEDFCDEDQQRCIGCGIRCNDGKFCNGAEVCIGDQCLIGEPPCADGFCDEDQDVCVTGPPVQRAPGAPLAGLDPGQLARFQKGRDAFEYTLNAAEGLGPIYNASSCASCHATVPGGVSDPLVTLFGASDGASFDPLVTLGGSLFQQQALVPECLESIPAEANVSAMHRSTSPLGSGLVQALADDAIAAGADTPPAGLSGRVHWTEPLESPGTVRAGRFGWKSRRATLPSHVAAESVDHLGQTNRLVTGDAAPNGDPGLLASCDAVADPEDLPDATGRERLDRLADYLRYLAPAPQTPASGLLGEVHFFTSGCAGCHTPQFTTPDDPQLEPALRNRTLRPYSDFLLHEMGASADGIAAEDAQPSEMRSAPLWGLRWRTRLWHDGRVSGGDFESRVRAAIDLHNVAESEAQASAQSFLGRSASVQSALIGFLASLGRREFDHDGDGDVDGADFLAFRGCFTGPGTFYTASHPCAVSDVDRDSDVDQQDYLAFLGVFDGSVGGSVPDGHRTPGAPLRLTRTATGQILADWSPSCRSEDDDYAVYEGVLGDFSTHDDVTCSTGGATDLLFTPSSGSAYYLVVPHNQLSEGGYGAASDGTPRPAAVQACRPKLAGGCD